jgi:hypothetical protein
MPNPGELKISDVEAHDCSYGWCDIQGKVTSTFATDQSDVEIIVVVRNQDGTVKAIDMDYLTTVPAGGTAQFNVQFIEMKGDEKIEVYASLT